VLELRIRETEILSLLNAALGRVVLRRIMVAGS
jgi:hypothetical protein